MSFNDNVVIVTGASSGIGAAAAIAFAENGASVAIVGRNQEKLQKVANICNQKGGKVLIINADVSKDADAKRIVDDTISNFGKLNVLVNNAGFGGLANILDSNAMEIFDKVMATNLRGAVSVTHQAAPHLVQSKGNIINISSVGGIGVLSPKNFAYGASKAGLDHFSRCIALSLAPKGVRVNTINPGPVKTDIVSNIGMNEAQVNAIYDVLKRGTALDRVADPEEIADLILFLASDKAKSITGSSIVSDNGTLLKGTLELQ